MKNETKFKIKVQERLKEIPNLWFTKVQNVSVRGVPDLLICFQGKFYGWELKTDVGSPDALQEYVLNRVRKAGGVGRIVSPNNVKEAFMEDFFTEY